MSRYQIRVVDVGGGEGRYLSPIHTNLATARANLRIARASYALTNRPPFLDIVDVDDPERTINEHDD